MPLRLAGTMNEVTSMPFVHVTDKREITRQVLEWRSALSKGLQGNISAPLEWDELFEAPYYTDNPAWDGYTSLLLWAAYAEQPQLQRTITRRCGLEIGCGISRK